MMLSSREVERPMRQEQTARGSAERGSPMVQKMDGGSNLRWNIHPADANKDGRITRQEAQKYVESKIPAAKPPEAKPSADVNQAKYPTVGEAIENTLTNAKNEFFESAKIAGVMAIPGVNVAAGMVYGRHMSEARKEIAQLPMDPDGKWKSEARAIVSKHHEAAEDEIVALPSKVAQGAVTAVENAVDGAVDAAETVWGGVTDAAGSAWDFAKTEVPRAAKAIGQDVAVLAIMANPLGAAPSAIIVGNHVAQAHKRIMDLPMDPEGKWKDQAHAIVGEEMAEAKQEILGLPGRAWTGVKDVSSAIYTGARDAGAFVVDGAVVAGEAIALAGEVVIDDMVAGAKEAGKTVVGGVVATGEAIADAGAFVVDGAVVAGEAIALAGEVVIDDMVAGAKEAGKAVEQSFDQARKGLGGAFESFGRWISGD